jgi:hypothetical protein
MPFENGAGPTTRSVSSRPGPDVRLDSEPPGHNPASRVLTSIILVALVARQKFSASLDGGPELVPASATPFLAGCRKLLDLGYDPRQRVVMRHLGADYDALSATIGAAANLTVQDDGAPRFRPWKPFLARDGSPPIAQRAAPATQDAHSTLATPEASHRGGRT